MALITRLSAFLSIPTQIMIFHLESVKVVNKLYFHSGFGQKIGILRGENEERKFRTFWKTCVHASNLNWNESLWQELSGYIIFFQKVALLFDKISLWEHRLFPANRLTYVTFTFYRDPSQYTIVYHSNRLLQVFTQECQKHTSEHQCSWDFIASVNESTYLCHVKNVKGQNVT